MGGYSGMAGGVMGGMSGGGKKKKEKKQRPPVKSFQPEGEKPAGEKKAYHPNVLRAREPIPNFQAARPASYDQGGKVRRGGTAKVEKGEEVLTAKQAREYRRTKARRISAAAKTGRHSRKTGQGKSKGAAKRIVRK